MKRLLIIFLLIMAGCNAGKQSEEEPAGTYMTDSAGKPYTVVQKGKIFQVYGYVTCHICNEAEPKADIEIDPSPGLRHNTGLVQWNGFLKATRTYNKDWRFTELEYTAIETGEWQLKNRISFNIGDQSYEIEGAPLTVCVEDEEYRCASS